MVADRMTRPDYLALARELAHTVSMIGENMAAESIAAQLEGAYGDGIADAAKCLEGAHFLFEIGTPGEGPFKRQDRTMREVVEQGAAAIRKLKDEPA